MNIEIFKSYFCDLINMPEPNHGYTASYIYSVDANATTPNVRISTTNLSYQVF